MEKKVDTLPPSPPPSVSDYDDSRSTYTVDQPPPAYRKPELPSVKVTKIVAVTLLLVTLIAGLTAVAIVYIQHNLKCTHMTDSMSLQQKTVNELPQSSKLIQDKPNNRQNKQQATKEKVNSKAANPEVGPSDAQDQMKRLNFPIHIDLDDITGKMMEKNQRARLNCVIEKKRSEEIIPRSSKTLQTPFGNLTTDPKFTHITGETMSLTCRGGNDRVAVPMADNPSVNSPSGPILIQIPIQKEAIPIRPSNIQQIRPQSPMARITPLLNIIRQQMQPLLPIQINPLAPPRQQQPQQPPNNARPPPQLIISPSHQVNIQGPFPMNHVGRDSPITQQQSLPQQPPQILENPLHRLLNPIQQVRIPLMPFPQLGIQHIIPHLLEVHKQIQQQRERAEQQRQHKDNSNESHNKMEQRQELDSDEIEMSSEGRPMHENQFMRAESHEPMPNQGRPIPIHEEHMQRLSVPPQPMGHMVPPQPPHFRENQQEPMNGPHHHMPEGHGPVMIRGHPNAEEMARQNNGRHAEQRAGVEIPLDDAPSFHNSQHVIPAEEMMYRNGPPVPFMGRSHNMQPRSSAHPRMKRMAGACSCVCK
ncbi:hypothetical protein CHUAL_011756 [Chamberlinius hualienensis]